MFQVSVYSPSIPISCLAGKYHKYDTIAYPVNVKFFSPFPKKEPGKFAYVVNRGLSYIWINSEGSAAVQESTSPPEYEDVVFYCLEVYLQKYKDLLCSDRLLDEENNVHSIAQRISVICHSFSEEILYSGSDKFGAYPNKEFGAYPNKEGYAEVSLVKSIELLSCSDNFSYKVAMSHSPLPQI